MIFLELKSPNSDEIARFNWKHSALTALDGNNEILQSIRYICQDVTDDRFRNFLAHNLDATTFNDFEKMKTVCDTFNQLVDEVTTKSQFQRLEHDAKPLAAADQLKFIMHLIYNRAVVEPDKLNQYEPFSPQVYGETSFDLIEQMLKKTTLKDNDLFMDLGSGVGNVVLQVAGSTRCRLCFGVEKAEWPAYYAVRMETEFRFWMNFFGKFFSKFKIYKGDFLSDEQMIEIESTATSEKTEQPAAARTISMGEYVKELINEANLIFVNNYAFGATVDHELKMRFCNMLEGALIVSSKPFCSLTFRISSRNLNDIGSILNTHDIEPISGHVSWTDKPISYYFQRIDRTNLEKYFERLKNSRFRDDNDNSNHNDSAGSHSSSPSSSSSPALSPNSDGSNSPKEGKASRSRRSVKAHMHSPASSTSRRRAKESRKRKEIVLTDAVNPDAAGKDQHEHNPMKKSKVGGTAAKSGKSSERQPIGSAKVLETLSRMHAESVDLMTNDGGDGGSSAAPGFNLKDISKLSQENCDVQRLKECKVLTKYSNNIFNELSQKSIDKLIQDESLINNYSSSITKPFPVIVNSAAVDVDQNPHVIDDNRARKELGDDFVNELDNYLKKCRSHYIKFLMQLNTDSYKEKLKAKLADQAERKKHLLAKISHREAEIKSLMNSGIKLIKTKSVELGLKSAKAPYELAEYAKTLVSDNQNLLNRIKSLQETVNNLEVKLTKHGVHKPAANGTSVSVVLDLAMDGTHLLDKILNQANGKSRSHLPELLAEHRSSSRSTNSTTTATEREDEADEDSRESLKEQTSAKKHGSDASKHHKHHSSAARPAKHSDKERSDKQVRVKAENDESARASSENKNRKPNSPSTSKILNQIFPTSAQDARLDSLRNFKIPRTTPSPMPSGADPAKKCKSPSTPPDSPSSMSSACSSSSSSNSKKVDPSGKLLQQSGALSGQEPSLSRQTSLSTSSDSNSNLASSFKCDGGPSASASAANDPSSGRSSTTAYYHPKKSQFRQYLMESSGTAPPSSSEPSSSEPSNNAPRASFKKSGHEGDEERVRHTRWSPAQVPPPTDAASTHPADFQSSPSRHPPFQKFGSTFMPYHMPPYFPNNSPHNNNNNFYNSHHSAPTGPGHYAGFHHAPEGGYPMNPAHYNHQHHNNTTYTHSSSYHNHHQNSAQTKHHPKK